MTGHGLRATWQMWLGPEGMFCSASWDVCAFGRYSISFSEVSRATLFGAQPAINRPVSVRAVSMFTMLQCVKPNRLSAQVSICAAGRALVSSYLPHFVSHILKSE